jgi:hypothetical protein
MLAVNGAGSVIRILMREREFFAGAAALLLSVLVMCVVRHVSNGGLAPVVTVLGIEPANIIDDAGAEMWLVTLSISNSVTWPNEPVFVKDSGVSVEAKVANRWVGVAGQIGDCALSHFQPHRIDVVLPANAGACRITFKWTEQVSVLIFDIKALCCAGSAGLRHTSNCPS